MKMVVSMLTAAVCAGFVASTFVHIRGLVAPPGDPWTLVLSVLAAGVVLTLSVLLAAWRIGIGRADGWWSRAMDGLSTWTYLAVAASLVYGSAMVAYTLWSRRGGPFSVHTTAIVAGATFMFFHAVLFAAARSLAVALRTPRA
jgi:hypothetical protein